MNLEPSPASPGTYRPNVAAIVKDSDGLILICERAGCPGAWQFPQGGVGQGESREDALKRELWEELSLPPSSYLLAESHGPFRYLFPPGRTKEGFAGQEQRYYLVELVGAKSAIDLATAHREFQAMRWIRPEKFDLDWLPPMKQPVYAAVLNAFFGLTFPGIPVLDDSKTSP